MCEWAVWVCQISTAFHTAPVLSTQCWGAQKQLRSPEQATTAPTPAFSQPGSPLHRAGGQGLDQAPDTLHHSLQPATPQAMPSSWHTPWKIVGFTLFFKALFDSKTDCQEGWDVVLPWRIGNQALDGTPSCAGSWAAQSLRGKKKKKITSLFKHQPCQGNKCQNSFCTENVPALTSVPSQHKIPSGSKIPSLIKVFETSTFLWYLLMNSLSPLQLYAGSLPDNTRTSTANHAQENTLWLWNQN